MLPNLGGTRSSLKSDHLLHTPDTFIRTPLSGADGVDFIVHTAPRLGAAFSWMTAEFAADSYLHEAPTGVQRFLYILEGELEAKYTFKISLDDPYAEEFNDRDTLTPGSFLYIPEDRDVTVQAKTKAKAVLIEKEYQLAD